MGGPPTGRRSGRCREVRRTSEVRPLGGRATPPRRHAAGGRCAVLDVREMPRRLRLGERPGGRGASASAASASTRVGSGGEPSGLRCDHSSCRPPAPWPSPPPDAPTYLRAAPRRLARPQLLILDDFGLAAAPPRPRTPTIVAERYERVDDRHLESRLRQWRALANLLVSAALDRLAPTPTRSSSRSNGPAPRASGYGQELARTCATTEAPAPSFGDDA